MLESVSWVSESRAAKGTGLRLWLCPVFTSSGVPNGFVAAVTLKPSNTLPRLGGTACDWVH